MTETYFVGVCFCCGVVFGSMLSTYFSDSRPHRTQNSDTYDTDMEQLYPFLDRAFLDRAYTLETDLEWLEEDPQMSHEEVDRIKSPYNSIHFEDKHKHKDNDDVAKKMFNDVRVLCWVMTSPDNLQKKAIHVKNTWTKHCNKVIFMSDSEDKEFPAVGLGTPLGRQHLTAKTMRAFDYVYKNHFNDADWFMKADDDTYVIVENLRYMLSTYAPTDPVYFGHHFKAIVRPQGYFSGGAGYVLSKEALTRFANRAPTACAKDNGAEDVQIGRCMQKLGVKTGDSRDKFGRSRFHCFPAEMNLIGLFPKWFVVFNKYVATKGIEGISDYPVSFHYVGVQGMYNLEYSIYHMGTYGIANGLQDLNRPVRKEIRL